MENLSLFKDKHQTERDFTLNEEAVQCFSSIVSYLSSSSWLQSASDEDKITLLSCLRLLLRDEKLIEDFLKNSSFPCILSEELQRATHRYLTDPPTDSESQFQTLLVTELTNIVQKLTHHSVSSHSLLLEYEVHKQLVFLLSSYDNQILQSSLNGLINFSKESEGRKMILGCYILDTIFQIMENNDCYTAQSSACDLFLLLSQENGMQDQVKELDLLFPCLSLVQSSSHALLIKMRLLESLERILDDEELMDSFRELGGIAIILMLITPNSFAGSSETHKILKACFSLLTSLSLNDMCAKQIVECNGLYLISHYLVASEIDERLQLFCVRTLRYLFSLERNRRFLKRLFPLAIFEDFVNIGHYVHNLSAYSKLVESLSSLSSEDKASLAANQKSLNQTSDPLCMIGGYAVLELLGTGAYGSVYKVRKGARGNLYALKEIRGNHPVMGPVRTSEDRNASVGRIMSEVAMIRENLRHANIVRYYKCFEEAQYLYIEMSLIDGAALSEFIMSLKEKKTFFSEERIWRIFSQLICALRYLHEDKKIVHRDLKPANMILGEQDKLTITDFGLAKLHGDFSVMNSTVGTMIYWCPELVESKDYDKKADIWAAGCILYEMASLQPPFYATNMLSLARKIAEGKFDLVPLEKYSSQMIDVASSCLTANPHKRPDSIQLGGMLTEHLMRQLDSAVYQLEAKTVKGSLSLKHDFHKERSERSRRQLFFGSASDTDAVYSQLTPTREFSPLLTTASSQVTTPHKDSRSDSVFSDKSAGPINSVLLKQRSYSLSPVPSYRARQAHSGSPILSVSPKNLREIADPLGDLLQMMHKLVFITQPSASFAEVGKRSSPSYSIIVRYTRVLFGNTFSTKQLKNELWKLVTSSKQDVSLLPSLPHLLSAAMTEYPHVSGDSENTVTYEDLHSFVDELLKKTDYYKTV